MSASNRPLRFGILGLSLSHPYAFAPYLKDRGHTIAAVWDPSAQKAAEFVETHGGAVLAHPEEGIGAGGCHHQFVYHLRPSGPGDSVPGGRRASVRG